MNFIILLNIINDFLRSFYNGSFETYDSLSSFWFHSNDWLPTRYVMIAFNFITNHSKNKETCHISRSSENYASQQRYKQRYKGLHEVKRVTT